MRFTRAGDCLGMLRAVTLFIAAIVLAWPSPALSAPDGVAHEVAPGPPHDAMRERARRVAALGAALEAGDEAAVGAAGRGLAQMYWRLGFLPEAAAALDIAGLADPSREPLYDLIMRARGLTREDARAPALTANDSVTATESLAAFMHAGAAAEAGRPVAAAALEAAAAGADAAPFWAQGRYAPALTEAAADAGARRVISVFAALAARRASPAGAAYARGRAAEAVNDVEAALAAYAEAQGRGRWPAMARLRTAALVWAEGRATPAETARTLEALLIDWPGEHVAAAALTALGRAYLFAGEPVGAAHALARVSKRYDGGARDAQARLAATRLDAVLEAVFVEDRYPEIGLGRRIDLYAHVRPYAATPFGGLGADLVHLDALLAADLLEEVVALTDADPDTAPERRAAALAALEAQANRGALVRADARPAVAGGPSATFDFSPFFAPPATPRLAPPPMPAVDARAALTRLDARWSALESAVRALEHGGDLSGAPS